MNKALQATLGALERIQNDLLPHVDPKDIEKEIEEASVINDNIYAALASIEHVQQHIINASPPKLTIPPAPAAVKLPELSLPTFKGSIVEWTTFWEAYKSSVHERDSLTKSQKFTYLQSLLEGKAKEAVAGLAITEANYDIAVGLLERRFGNQEQIVGAHMDKLMSLETVHSDKHVAALRALYDTTEITIRSLTALGVTIDSYGALLTQMFIPKLPPELRLTITRSIPKTEWNMTKILEVLLVELEVRERATGKVPAQDGRVERRDKPTRTLRPPPTMNTYVANTTRGCSYCGEEGHSSQHCKRVSSVEDRKGIIRSNKLCFNCLRSGHIGRQCNSASRCRNCQGKHHTSICTRSTDQRQYSRPKQNNPPNSSTPRQSDDSTRRAASNSQAPKQSGMNPYSKAFSPAEKTPACYTHSNSSVFLQTARATACNPQRPHIRRSLEILFDSGSQCSYITERASRELGLRSLGIREVNIMTFGSKEESLTSCKVVRLRLMFKTGGSSEFKFLVVPHICEPVNTAALDIAHYPYLQSVQFTTNVEQASQFYPDILIGSDQYWLLMTGEIIREPRGPVAMDTHIGWILSGEAKTKGTHSRNSTLMTHVLRVDGVQQIRALEKQLHMFWDIESLGIIDSEDVVQTQFGSNVRFDNGRYTVSLPWKESCIDLSRNYRLSVRRLNNLHKRLSSTPEILNQYNSVIQEQVQLGIVVPVDEHRECSNRIHYIPHHAVIRKDKTTTKLRVVYDASAKGEGLSLNECLHIGPSLHQRIWDILLRFRLHTVALISDIEKAFLMVQVTEEDQDVLRFLWYKDVHAENLELQTYKFTRIVFGVAPSPYLLNATIMEHLKQFEVTQAQVVNTIKKSIYVDDVVTGCSNTAEGIQLYKDMKDIFRVGGFNLRKFKSNNIELQQYINQIEGEPTASGTSYAQDTVGEHVNVSREECKVLGIAWDVNQDELVMNLQSIREEAQQLQLTKRNVISLVSKVYDPMGLVSPVIIQFKIYFQEICQSKLSWDEPLSTVLQEKWKHLLKSLVSDRNIRVPRCYFQEFSGTFNLIGFCDASVKAYAAVVYIQNGNGDCNIVAAKTRVAPLQTQTIPRLELLGALLLTRLMLSASKCLGKVVSECECYTDSLVVLQWIKGVNKQWKPFVQNRVTEIRKGVPTQKWSHCQGKNNPADIPSRGISLQLLTDSQLWFHGPDWLRDRTAPTVLEGPLPTECMVEMKVTDKERLTLQVAIVERGLENIIQVERFSSYDKLIAVTALVLKFISSFKKATASVPVVSSSVPVVNSSVPVVNSSVPVVNSSVPVVNSSVPVVNSSVPVVNASVPVVSSSVPVVNSSVPVVNSSVPVVNSSVPVVNSSVPVVTLQQSAEILWLREVQRNNIRKEWKSQFTLYQDKDGLWRCGGRLHNADISYDARHPILILKTHPLATLIVRRAHYKVHHSGVKDTLTEIRSRFWIPQGRSFVQQFIRRCVVCKRYGGNSYKPPKPPPLPVYRVQSSQPFSSSGVDYAGPLIIKSNTLMPCKVWICLFTCCTSRAVHLEIVTDLSPESFMRALKRFVSRRGLPSTIISDNGTTFKGASKQIKEILRHPIVQQYMNNINLKWIFNVERAPWWGGFFERMVQLTKRCLRKMIGNVRLSYDELNTALIEVEAILNSRPLTYVSSMDLDEPLTPSHLLTGRRLLTLPDYVCYDEDVEYTPSTRRALKGRVAYVQSILNNFWLRWKREYLLELRENQRYRGNEHVTPITIGDVVLIHDDDRPRRTWRLGLVENTILGKDNQIRGAVVRVKSGNGPSSFMRRPIQRLFPLEVRSTDRNVENPSDRQITSTCSNNNHQEIRDDIEGIPSESNSHKNGQNTNNYSSSSLRENNDNLDRSDRIEMDNDVYSSGIENNQHSGLQVDSVIGSHELTRTLDAQDIVTQSKSTSRPRRKAAFEARDRIVAQYMENKKILLV